MKKVFDQLERFGKGVASPTRCAIIRSLIGGPKTVGALARRTGLSQPAISQHMRTLQESGIVARERRGQEVRYSLMAERLSALLDRFSVAVRSRAKRTARKARVA